ncbi:MAG TPA: hypothetical protein VMT86_12030 [Bryobacteraceae bacterium]|nr:hypothetical protein [Bryobacteraceae bacterium]
MRGLVALGVALAWAAVAQNEKLPEQPPEKPLLQNTGKPMVVDCHCTAEDIQASGLTCTNDDPCALFLELDAVETVGNRIFLAGNIHTSTVTLYSVLLASDDGGKTWLEPYERIPAAGLDHIQFIDFQNGWISGEVQRPLPRDPFLLATEDGGKEWRSQPVFSDSQFGSVLQFGFTSPTNGTLIVDRGAGGESGRYETYETLNGGATWMPRQANQQPRQVSRTAGSGNADWRLRADAATKAYRVEHHTGGAWRGVAAFAVSIGACRPPEPVAAPPADSRPSPAP